MLGYYILNSNRRGDFFVLVTMTVSEWGGVGVGVIFCPRTHDTDVYV